jgi:glycosyltransferase involved in cell wall biosynthesis
LQSENPKSPPISIVIPAYNAAAFIGRAITSVLDSDYPREQLEVVIVDDGSTDATGEQARAGLSPAGIAWSIQRCERGGPSRARNLGWRFARGEWIQFLDADDTLASSKLSHQVECACPLAPTVAVVYSAWAALKSGPGPVPSLRTVRAPAIGVDPVLDLLKTENFLATGSQLFRRAWLERVGGFDERNWFVEDVDLALRVAMAGGRFVRTAASQPLFFYHQRSGSLSRSDRPGFSRGCVRNARMAECFWEQTRGGVGSEQRKVLLEIYGNALRVFYEIARPEFWELLSHVRQLDPAYCPAQPAVLGWLSRRVGYERAESLALLYRRMKQRIVLGRRTRGGLGTVGGSE